MKFIVEIRNVDTLETHNVEVEKENAPKAHKDIYMNVLEIDEEISCITDSEGHIVFDNERGFVS